MKIQCWSVGNGRNIYEPMKCYVQWNKCDVNVQNTYTYKIIDYTKFRHYIGINILKKDKTNNFEAFKNNYLGIG